MSSIKEKQPKYKKGDVIIIDNGTYVIDEIDSSQHKKEYIYYNCHLKKNPRFFGTIAEDSVELHPNYLPITEEMLENNGWEYFSELQDAFKGYKKTIECDGKTFHCDLIKTSNTPNRDWFVHVDNDIFESVGTMDVSNFHHINEFLKLLAE